MQSAKTGFSMETYDLVVNGYNLSLKQALNNYALTADVTLQME